MKKMSSKKRKINAKTESKKTKTWAILLVVFCGFLGAIAQLLLKIGSERINESITSIFNLPLLFGFVFYGLATILFIISLKHGEVTILYPIIATSYVWVSLFSSYFLHENITLAKWGGDLLIILGVSLIGYSSKISSNTGVNK